MSNADKYTIEMLMSQADENRIQIFGLADDEHSATLTVRLRKYDREAREYVNDEDTYQKAVETLTAIGLGSCINEDGEIQAEDLDVDGQTYEGYVDTDNDVASLHPIRKIVRTEKVVVEVANTFNKKWKNDVFGAVAVTEMPDTRFQVIIRAQDADGETKLYNVSRLVWSSDDVKKDDRGFSLNYSNKVGITEKAVSDTPEDRRAKMELLRSKALAKKRAEVVDSIKEFFGFDLEANMEKTDQGEAVDPLRLSVQADSNDFGDGKKYWLVGTVLDSDTEVTNPAPGDDDEEDADGPF